MLCFDVGANRGDFTKVALEQGYDVIALEPAPRVYAELVKAFIYDKRVLCLRNAVAETNQGRVDFYECVEDGLSTLNKEWLTKPTMPYAGKSYQTIEVTTITLDYLAHTYGAPDLIKVDVEGAEWQVFKGLSQAYGELTFEWTFATIEEHEAQLDYLHNIGYKYFAPQYIEHHGVRPTDYYELTSDNAKQLYIWHQETSDAWIEEGWKKSGLRPTADVGMCWLKQTTIFATFHRIYSRQPYQLFRLFCTGDAARCYMPNQFALMSGIPSVPFGGI